MVAWPDGEPELVAYVREQQNTALSTYEVNPDLMEEHVNQEESFRVGGYGQRQISELLQNAVDALTMGKKRGAIEFRVADGALYCANEGEPFARKGVRAVCYAFLSPKREEEIIGRFGLGFKSVLGITNHPQVFSRSVSFDFNAPGSEELFASIPAATGRPLPLLRVPSLIDVAPEAKNDPHLAEMMEWASTIVKLPLTNDGPRIRAELAAFATESLLFMKSVDQLTISLQDTSNKLLTNVHRRETTRDSGTIRLHAPGAAPMDWLFAERDYAPSDAVLKTLPENASRRKMGVSYAVPVDGSASLGAFWAWFPLRDQTTARGIFNAPWQVNDDRTTMLTASALNGEMLGVCAELFLDVAVRASTPEDPAAHLDLFPARGREARSAADRMLSELIPELARRRPIIPDATGTLQAPGYFKGVPDLSADSVPPELMSLWQSVVKRRTIPHPSAFTSARDRDTRLRSLLRESDTESSAETTVRHWLEELAHMRNLKAVGTALTIYQNLRGKHDTLGGALIVPTEGDDWARADSFSSTLIPRLGEVSPDGLALLDAKFAGDSEIVRLLKILGFQEVSADQIAIAFASRAENAWKAADWSKFWSALNAANASAAARAITESRERGVDILVHTLGKEWRRATEVFTEDAQFPQLVGRHADPLVHRSRGDLLALAGCLSGPSDSHPIFEDALIGEYRDSVHESFSDQLRAEGLSAKVIDIPEYVGAGPLDLFTELGDDKGGLASWTIRMLSLMREKVIPATAHLTNGKTATLSVASPEWWSILKFGRVRTSRGLSRPTRVVATSLRDYAAFLPVVEAEAGIYLSPPKTLQEVPDALLEAILTSPDPRSADQAITLMELLVETASRSKIAVPEKIPAVLGDEISLHLRTEVVLADSDEDIALLRQHGVPYVPGSAKTAALATKWSLPNSADALSRSTEVQDPSDESPLLDVFPSLASISPIPLSKVRLARSRGIVRKTTSPTGLIETRLSSIRQDSTVIVDDTLDPEQVLAQVSRQLGLELSPSDIRSVLADDERLHRSELIAQVRAADSDATRLLLLVGAQALKEALPRGLLAAIEAKRGTQSGDEVAALFARVKGNDALWELRDPLKRLGLPVPEKWAGSPAASSFVASLGFPSAFAGTRTVTAPSLVQVQGRIEINALHDFQQELAMKVRTLTLERNKDGSAQRGLLFLPTGAGKTRVTVEAIVQMFLAGELKGPILWIAQSQELCEQAIQTWIDVWKALGDEKVLDLCRFWEGHELDESDEDFQIVVATDDKLTSRIGSRDATQYTWLADASLVVVDEAHTALSPTYTNILRWLGLTAFKSERPLLGLTATPYRGRNAEVNKRFVERFGSTRLESLDPDDPIGQLRRQRVLAEVDHELLDGGTYRASDFSGITQMNEISRSMLDHIGQDLDRTERLVNHILKLDGTWPILVFAASVASAHTIAALLQLEGKNAAAVDGSMRGPERRRIIGEFSAGETQILVNCDLLTQGFDAPKVRALYVARPTFSPNRYHQMIGRGLRGPENGGKERCLIVNIKDTFEQFGEELAFTEFDYLWKTS